MPYPSKLEKRVRVPYPAPTNRGFMRDHLDADMRSVYKRLAVSPENRWILDLIPQKMYLSPVDFKFLVDMIENPPAPSANLIALMKGK